MDFWIGKVKELGLTEGNRGNGEFDKEMRTRK
jgi:hypothetical protein